MKANGLNHTGRLPESLPHIFWLVKRKTDKLLVSTAQHVIWPTEQSTSPYAKKQQTKSTQITVDARNGPSLYVCILWKSVKYCISFWEESKSNLKQPCLHYLMYTCMGSFHLCETVTSEIYTGNFSLSLSNHISHRYYRGTLNAPMCKSHVAFQ